MKNSMNPKKKRKKKQKRIWPWILTTLLILFCMTALVWACISVLGNQRKPVMEQANRETEEMSPAAGPDEAVDKSVATETPTERENADAEAFSETPDAAESATGTAEEETAPPSVPAEAQKPADDFQSLCQQFLNNQLSVTISDSYPEDNYADYMESLFERGTSCTLEELKKCVSEYFLHPEFSEKTSCDYIQYAYVECPDTPDTDDRNLLLKFVGLDIYSPEDKSYAVCVITQDQGQLYLTDAYQCWARSETIAYRNGTLSGFGSSGAGAHSDELSVLLSDGRRESIYEAEILSGWWAGDISHDIYQEVFGPDMVAYLTVCIYTIGDTDYYLYDLSECTEEDRPLSQLYISRCQESLGINWVTEADIETAIHNRCAALGVDNAILRQQEEPAWLNVR